MLTLSTFSDITHLEDKLDKPTCIYLQQRFKQLHKTYCSSGSVPLERFCLHDYGEILIAERFSEININAYESIDKINLDSTVIYRAAWVRNNDICDDVIIFFNIIGQATRVCFSRKVSFLHALHALSNKYQLDIVMLSIGNIDVLIFVSCNNELSAIECNGIFN